MKITNTQNDSRTVNTMYGPLVVEPGQSVHVEISGAELEVIRNAGWFEIARTATKANSTDDNEPPDEGHLR
jgi:hypothetical protein